MSRSALLFAASVVLALVVLTPSPAAAWLRVCNQSNESVSVAVADIFDEVFDTSEYSKGWWNIEVGACAKPIDEDLSDLDTIYLYADSTHDTWGGGNYFCVDPQDKFNYQDDTAESKCTGVKRGFRKLDTGNWKNYTYTLYSR